MLCQPGLSEGGKAGYEPIVKKFFEIFKTGDTNKAVDYVFSTSNYINKDSVIQVKNQMMNMKSLVGSYHGFELINSKKIGKSLISITYLVKYERQPIRFRFTFYKPRDEWMILSFAFDDNLDTELEESTKISD
jgi:hypothetical protein